MTRRGAKEGTGRDARSRCRRCSGSRRCWSTTRCSSRTGARPTASSSRSRCGARWAGATTEEWTVSKVKVNPKIDPEALRGRELGQRCVHGSRSSLLLALAAAAAARRPRPRAGHGRDRHAPSRRPGSQRRGDSERLGRRQGDRTGDAGSPGAGGGLRRPGRRDRAEPAGRPLRRQRHVPRVREPDGHRRARARRRQSPRGDAGDREGGRKRRGRPRSGDRRVGSEERALRQRPVQGSDRGAARRSRRDGKGAEGDGRARRDDPRGRVPRRQAAAEVADPIDPLLQRDVRRRQSQRGTHVRRHRDAAWARADARQHGLLVPRRRAERAQRVPVRQGTRSRRSSTT